MSLLGSAAPRALDTTSLRERFAPGTSARWWVLTTLSAAGYGLALAAAVLLIAHDGGRGYDSYAYWLAGRRVLSGEPLYQPAAIDTLGAYLYPPLFPQLWAPFTFLPELWFGWAWRIGCLLCLRYLAGSWRNVGLWMLFPLTLRELAIANVTFPVAAVTFRALRTGGLLLPLAGLLKFGPMLALPYLWLRRPEQRSALVRGVGLTAGACLVSFLVAPASWQLYFASLGWRSAMSNQDELLFAILPTAGADFVLRFSLAAVLVAVAAMRGSDRLTYLATVVAVPTLALSRLSCLFALPRLAGSAAPRAHR